MSKQKVLIVGAGEAGRMVLNEINKHPKAGMEVAGFIDDDSKKINKLIKGKKVLGDRTAILQTVKDHDISLVIISLPSVKQKEIYKIVEICEKANVKIQIVPSTYDIIQGVVKFGQIRDINIEDLLGREEIILDIKKIKTNINNKTVLITGAGGSIGSEIARQITRMKPKKMILIDKSENGIFNINWELSRKSKISFIDSIICNINNKQKIENIFKKHKPDIIFHAAANKHVHLMEFHPDEAIQNNIFGTLSLIQLAIKYKVKKFILISTDKAVNPVSVMGMTKRITEKMIIGFQQKSRNTILCAVRFGNVLNSRGSVVPIFKKQIQDGGPVTVTDPKVKRYFMTIPEAVQLVLQAGSVARGGEIFILDMGEPVKIIDLAAQMIKLSGYIPGQDIKIRYTGLKSGEKLNESLVFDHKNVNTTDYDKIFVEKHEKISIDDLMSEINKMINIDLYKKSKKELIKLIKNLI